MLKSNPGDHIVHDPRLVWNTREEVLKAGGTPQLSKAGHSFIKETMRSNNSVYGGEMSGHHYFRDFFYSDSGMIPWLLVWEILSKNDVLLADLISERRARFPSSGEINFTVLDATKCIQSIKNKVIFYF